MAFVLSWDIRSWITNRRGRKVSGSTRSKRKRRTGPQDITNGRGAELIELAVVLTRHPRAARAKAALTRTANELLEQGSDAIIDQAIAAAPSRRIAHTLQLAVEGASERVVIYRNGVRAELVLFAIPIITTFDQDVPESQFETALSSLGDLKDLARRRKSGKLELAPMVLLPKLFRLDDLNTMPLSMVRKRGIQLGTAAVSPGSEWHPSMTRTKSLKRSAVFLRFLVGQRPTLGPDDGAAGEAELCERLGNLTKQAIKHRLGMPCHVRAVHLGSFHENSVLGHVAVPGDAAGSARACQLRTDATDQEATGQGGDLRPRVPI